MQVMLLSHVSLTEHKGRIEVSTYVFNYLVETHRAIVKARDFLLEAAIS